MIADFCIFFTKKYIIYVMRPSKRYKKSENKILQERRLKRMRSKWSKLYFCKKSLEETSSNTVLKELNNAWQWKINWEMWETVKIWKSTRICIVFCEANSHLDHSSSITGEVANEKFWKNHRLLLHTPTVSYLNFS